MSVPASKIVNKPTILSPPIIFPDIQIIQLAAKQLMNAKSPLVIVGKGNEHKNTLLTIAIFT